MFIISEIYTETGSIVLLRDNYVITQALFWPKCLVTADLFQAYVILHPHIPIIMKFIDGPTHIFIATCILDLIYKFAPDSKSY